MGSRINISVLWLLSPDGSGLLSGGMERWCRDLASLVTAKGFEVVIYQKATKSFSTELQDGVTVTGVPASLRFHGNFIFSRWLSRNVDRTDPMVFVSQELALSGSFERAAAVNHGIWWDGDKPFLKRAANRLLQYRLLRHLRGVICVDTNYINWCHAELPNRQAWEHKLVYVPNYADTVAFTPGTTESSSGPLRILFPRRMPAESLERSNRGLGLLMQAARILEHRGMEIELLLAGPCELQGQIAQWKAENGLKARIHIEELPLDQMPTVYHSVDVVVVPTLAHEGSSLAAIEAIVSGKPVVVSHIGGLANIVVDGLNGYVCDLSPESLADAIERAYEEHCLSRPGLLGAVRQCFSRNRWERRTWHHLARMLGL